MVGEIQTLLDRDIEIDVAPFTAALSRMQKHVFDNGIGPTTVLGHLLEIVFHRAGKFADAGARFIFERRPIDDLFEFVQKVARKIGEIIDEVKRVLDLMRDAGGELT